ncbi:hypothetical protein C1Y63_11610 [Corynebacterium sp. 13CS0277]|uniref:hypothetical protein n=1 Tax=Corynebacterium sp. 13CS0277 TaxID=2071994 RepID=UPI000D03CCA5|nr:hypothetical protein [Corynebacterium sp. 13CS0277]PRQ10404.1 hypothetical protein C1Y63_11610 [Corynebacterium sp. 13CS0277]
MHSNTYPIRPAQRGLAAGVRLGASTHARLQSVEHAPVENALRRRGRQLHSIISPLLHAGCVLAGLGWRRCDLEFLLGEQAGGVLGALCAWQLRTQSSEHPWGWQDEPGIPLEEAAARAAALPLRIWAQAATQVLHAGVLPDAELVAHGEQFGTGIDAPTPQEPVALPAPWGATPVTRAKARCDARASAAWVFTHAAQSTPEVTEESTMVAARVHLPRGAVRQETLLLAHLSRAAGTASVLLHPAGIATIVGTPARVASTRAVHASARRVRDSWFAHHRGATPKYRASFDVGFAQALNQRAQAVQGPADREAHRAAARALAAVVPYTHALPVLAREASAVVDGILVAAGGHYDLAA